MAPIPVWLPELLPRSAGNWLFWHRHYVRPVDVGHAGTPEHETEPRRRDDAGTFKITDRDITGLSLCAEQYGAPYDLLAAALDVTIDRLRGIVLRWPHAGYATHRRPGPGPGLVLADSGRCGCSACPTPPPNRS